MNLRELEQSARKSMAEALDYDQDDGPSEPHDLIAELADSLTPVYTSDLLELAADHSAFTTDEPELGPAFGGEPTPVNIIAANVYEYLTAVLWDEFKALTD